MAELDVALDKRRAGPDDLGGGQARLELLHTRRAPTGVVRSEAQLGHRDERDERHAPGDETVVPCGQRRGRRGERRTEDGRVDDGGPYVRPGGHASLSAAQKASASSSVSSSITSC